MNLDIYPKRFGARFPIMPIFTTRGCPFGCKFCSVTKYFGKSYRIKPVANVLREIDSTRAKDFLFVDDNIACNRDYCVELFQALVPKNINWCSQISTTVLKHPELIDLAAKAGCFNLFMGVESLNRASLNTVRKGFNNVEHYEELIARMRKAGILPFLSFIFGFDEDTPDQFRLTLEFIKKNKVAFASFWILTPLPGTDMFSELKKTGRLQDNNNWSLFDLTNVVFQPKHFTKQQLSESYWKSYQELYSWKNIIVNLAYSVTRAKKPINEFFIDVFYHTYYRKKVYSYDHPFSGGIDMIKRGDEPLPLASSA